MRSELVAWAAGFFEGEGCFYAHKGRPRKDGTYRITFQASLSQKGDNGEQLLRKFAEIVGCGLIYHTRGPKDMWIWKADNRADAVSVLHTLKSWLSPRRIKRAYEIMEAESRQTDQRGAANRRRAVAPYENQKAHDNGDVYLD